MQPDPWQAALGELQLQLPRSTFDAWLQGAILVEHDPETNEYTIGVLNPYARDWLENRLQAAILRTLAGITGRPARARFLVLAGEADEADDSDDEPPEPAEPDWERLGVPRRFLTKSLADLDWECIEPRQTRAALQAYAGELADQLEVGQGLCLIGTPGAGKTHAAVGLLKAAVLAGFAARFVTAADFFAGFRAIYDRNTTRSENSLTDDFLQPGLLVLDELTPDLLTPWAGGKLHALVKARYNAGQALVVTSNWTLDELAFPERGVRGLYDGTVSRLREITLSLPFEGGDYRERRKARFSVTGVRRG